MKRMLCFVCSAYVSDNIISLRYVVVLIGQLSFSIFSLVIQGSDQQRFILVAHRSSIGKHSSMSALSYFLFPFYIFFFMRLYLEAIFDLFAQMTGTENYSTSLSREKERITS